MAIKLPDWPSPGKPILNQWGRDVVNFLRSLRPSGDGSRIFVTHTADGVNIRLQEEELRHPFQISYDVDNPSNEAIIGRHRDWAVGASRSLPFDYRFEDFITVYDAENGWDTIFLTDPERIEITADDQYIYYRITKDAAGVITKTLKVDTDRPGKDLGDHTDGDMYIILGKAKFNVADDRIIKIEQWHDRNIILSSQAPGSGGSCTDGTIMRTYVEDVFVVNGTPDILRKKVVTETLTFIKGLFCGLDIVETTQDIGEWCCPTTGVSCNAPCDPICVSGAGSDEVNGEYAFTGSGVSCCEWTHKQDANIKIRRAVGNTIFVIAVGGQDFYVSTTFGEGTCPCPSTQTFSTAPNAQGVAPAPTVTNAACPSSSICGGQYLHWPLNDTTGSSVVVDIIDSNDGTVNGAFVSAGVAIFDGINDNIVNTAFCENATGDFTFTINMNFKGTNADEARLFAVGGINIRWDSPTNRLKLNGNNGGVSAGDKNQITGTDYSDSDISIEVKRTGTNLTIKIGGVIEWNETVTVVDIDDLFLCSQFNNTSFCEATVSSVILVP